MKTKTLKLNKELAGKKVGDTVEVEVDRDGVIIDRYWRRRLEDAKIDNCVEIVTQKRSSKP